MEFVPLKKKGGMECCRRDEIIKMTVIISARKIQRQLTFEDAFFLGGASFFWLHMKNKYNVNTITYNAAENGGHKEVVFPSTALLLLLVPLHILLFSHYER